MVRFAGYYWHPCVSNVCVLSVSNGPPAQITEGRFEGVATSSRPPVMLSHELATIRSTRDSCSSCGCDRHFQCGGAFS